MNHVCTESCNPGNCEVAHHDEFGWPFPDETWQEVADHQLDHDPTPAQEALHSSGGTP